MSAALILLGAYVAYLPFLPGAYISPKLFCIALGAAWGLWTQSPKEHAPLRPAFAAVGASAFLSSLLADSPAAALAGHTNGFSAGFPGVLLAWLCYEAGPWNPTTPRLLAVGASLTALAAGCQVAFGWFILDILPQGRAYGFAGSPPFLGCMLALAAPLAWDRGWAVRAAILLGVYLAGSKAGAIGYVVGLAVLLRGPREAGIGAVLTLAAGLWLGAQRVSGDLDRMEVWLAAWKAFTMRPVFGWGVDGFGDAFMLLRDPVSWGWKSFRGMESAHMLILDVLVSTGLVGAAAWGFLGWKAWKRNFPRSLVAATAAVLAYGFFNPTPFTAFAVLAYLWGEHDSTRD